jgi:hypothetical protein
MKLKAWAAQFPTMEKAAEVAQISRATLFNVISGAVSPSKETMDALDAIGAVPFKDWASKRS